MFAGTVLVAAFSDVKMLTEIYRLEGVLPVLALPVRIPRVLAFFNGFLTSTRLSTERIGRFVQLWKAEGTRHGITLIHAQDDMNISASYAVILAWRAVNATKALGIAREDLALGKERRKVDAEDGRWKLEWRTRSGVIREERPRYESHDEIKTYPMAGLAVFRIFQATILAIEHHQVVQTGDRAHSEK